MDWHIKFYLQWILATAFVRTFYLMPSNCNNECSALAQWYPLVFDLVLTEDALVKLVSTEPVCATLQKTSQLYLSCQYISDVSAAQRSFCNPGCWIVLSTFHTLPQICLYTSAKKSVNPTLLLYNLCIFHALGQAMGDESCCWYYQRFVLWALSMVLLSHRLASIWLNWINILKFPENQYKISSLFIS